MARRSGMILGGLLAGLGGGLVQEAQNRREEALLRLREGMAIAGEERAEARDVREFDRESELKVGLLQLQDQYRQREGETAQQYKERLLEIEQRDELERIDRRGQVESRQIRERGAIDERLSRVKADLDLRNDRASQRLAQEIDRGETSVEGVSPQGYIIIKRGDGTLITTRTKMASGDAADEGGTIAAARERRNGGGGDEGRQPGGAVGAALTRSSTAPTPLQLQNSVDAMLQSGSLPPGEAVGQKLTAPDGTELTWNGQRWIVPLNRGS